MTKPDTEVIHNITCPVCDYKEAVFYPNTTPKPRTWCPECGYYEE